MSSAKVHSDDVNRVTVWEARRRLRKALNLTLSASEKTAHPDPDRRCRLAVVLAFANRPPRHRSPEQPGTAHRSPRTRTRTGKYAKLSLRRKNPLLTNDLLRGSKLLPAELPRHQDGWQSRWGALREAVVWRVGRQVSARSRHWPPNPDSGRPGDDGMLSACAPRESSHSTPC